MPCAIVVHGGCGKKYPDDEPTEAIVGCRRAAERGFEVLAAGGSALDAVTAAAIALEDDPQFNAGHGACLNVEGEIELDAAVMDGVGLRAGAVAAVREVKNPVLLARAVMEHTPHVLLCARGAEAFADERGLVRASTASLTTAKARVRFEAERQARVGGRSQGTIGAVACDAQGRVAAATSTGGMSWKRVGRVGDSPLIGAGTYADPLGGAVSCTGHGEAILRVQLARFASEQLRAGVSPEVAGGRALEELSRVSGEGGLILVDPRGRIAHAFNTERMARAFLTSEGASGAGFDR